MGECFPVFYEERFIPGYTSLVAISDLGIGVYRADLLSHEGS